MIQFNLLPDVKLEFIKARRAKRSVMLISFISASSALAVAIILFAFVGGAQKKYMNDLSKDIKNLDSQLQNTQDLDKILTIQNQLNSLTDLHDQKAAATRLFFKTDKTTGAKIEGYITQLTPANASISELKVDFVEHTIVISGGADSLSTVNKFADTLKFTNYTKTDDDESTDDTALTKAFSNVVLTEFERTSDKTTYKIEAAIDPNIFDNRLDITLSVPQIISTRSETEKPAALFDKQEEDK